MKAEICINDLTGRFKKGEIGECKVSNNSKYDYEMDLGYRTGLLFNKIIKTKRIYYFYANEIRIIEDK